MSLSAATDSMPKKASLAKAGAFVCFGVAGGLMIATLMQPAAIRGDLGNNSLSTTAWAKN
jgi:hypothetical protein